MPETVIAGRYKLEDLLGRGGMSEVYCAEDLELGRRVALKLLARDADTARFEREARAVASLGHPNVMQLYDYGEDAGRPYMVLEYVPGGTLENRLAAADGKPLPDAEARAVSAGIAAGLAHAHSRGVIHRDLKPANVLFDEEGRPKLADFGIARMAAGEGTLTEAGTVLGTAAYISPEQAAGEPASAASDVYSFGVMLYRMLTGRLPFESNDPMELVLMNRDQPPPPIAELRKDPPGLLESTAMAALEKDPADRPQDGAALLAALGAAGATAATVVAATGATDATRVLPTVPAATASGETAYAAAPPAPPGRSRMPLLAAALVLLLLAGGALAYEVTKPDSSNGGTPGQTLPTIEISTKSATQATTTQPTTAPPPTTQPTTTHETTTRQHTTTTQPTTTAAPPPTTTALPPPPTTTAPPPPPTTTTPQPTTLTQPATTGP